MDPYPYDVLERVACAALQDADLVIANDARDAIGRIPAYLATPAVIAAIATSLHALAMHLSEQPREVAEGYLIDLVDDMKGFANEH